MRMNYSKLTRSASLDALERAPIERKVLYALEQLGSGNASDIAAYLGMKTHQIRPRATELCKAGRIVEVGMKPDRESGKPNVVYALNTEGRDNEFVAANL